MVAKIDVLNLIIAQVGHRQDDGAIPLIFELCEDDLVRDGVVTRFGDRFTISAENAAAFEQGW